MPRESPRVQARRESKSKIIKKKLKKWRKHKSKLWDNIDANCPRENIRGFRHNTRTSNDFIRGQNRYVTDGNDEKRYDLLRKRNKKSKVDHFDFKDDIVEKEKAKKSPRKHKKVESSDEDDEPMPSTSTAEITPKRRKRRKTLDENDNEPCTSKGDMDENEDIYSSQPTHTSACKISSPQKRVESSPEPTESDDGDVYSSQEIQASPSKSKSTHKRVESSPEPENNDEEDNINALVNHHESYQDSQINGNCVPQESSDADNNAPKDIAVKQEPCEAENDEPLCPMAILEEIKFSEETERLLLEPWYPYDYDAKPPSRYMLQIEEERRNKPLIRNFHEEPNDESSDSDATPTSSQNPHMCRNEIMGLRKDRKITKTRTILEEAKEKRERARKRNEELEKEIEAKRKLEQEQKEQEDSDSD